MDGRWGLNWRTEVPFYPLLLKWRIVDFFGAAAFHGIKQPTLFLELLE
jgi:hypothetical protein